MDTHNRKLTKKNESSPTGLKGDWRSSCEGVLERDAEQATPTSSDSLNELRWSR